MRNFISISCLSYRALFYWLNRWAYPPNILVLPAVTVALFVWVASFAKGGPVNEFHAVSGVRVKTSQLGLVDGAHDLVITPTGRILVSSANDDRIVEPVVEFSVVLV